MFSSNYLMQMKKAVGDFIKINEINYKVVGVFEQGDFDFGGQLHIPFYNFSKGL